jgi:hypothetical protein
MHPDDAIEKTQTPPRPSYFEYIFVFAFIIAALILFLGRLAPAFASSLRLIGAHS